jgi:hypothetical protein
MSSTLSRADRVKAGAEQLRAAKASASKPYTGAAWTVRVLPEELSSS